MKLWSQATWLMAALWLSGIGGLTASAQAPKAPARQPDVLVLLFAIPGGPDQVGLTYPGLVPHAQALRDVHAIQTATGWNVSGIHITDQSAPISKATGKMTGIDFVVPSAVTLQSHTLPIEPFVNSLRTYHHVTVTYLMGNNFAFQGLRGYADNHYNIALEQRGSTFTYQVYYQTGHYGPVSLPRYQLPTAAGRSVQASERRPVSPWLLALVAVAAVVTGSAVYALLARNA